MRFYLYGFNNLAEFFDWIRGFIIFEFDNLIEFMELDKILKLYHNSMDETNIFVMCMIELYFLKFAIRVLWWKIMEFVESYIYVFWIICFRRRSQRPGVQSFRRHLFVTK